MIRLTENDVEKQEVRNHEWEREIQQGAEERLVGRRREGEDEALCDGVQQGERPEGRYGLFEYVYWADSGRKEVSSILAFDIPSSGRKERTDQSVDTPTHTQASE